MRKKITLLLALALGISLLLCACSGNPLPDGMTEDEVLSRGREVVEQLNAGEWQEIYDALREDGKETTSPEDIQVYMESAVDTAGSYVREDDAMATGQKLDGTKERYGTAVFYCKHEKKDIVYRIAFSTEMELMGLQVKVR